MLYIRLKISLIAIIKIKINSKSIKFEVTMNTSASSNDFTTNISIISKN